MFSQYTINDKWKKNMKYTLFRICLILLLSGCVSAAQPEDSSSLPESESSLSQAESESSSLPEISSQPEEFFLSSQSETSSYGQEVSEPGLASGSLQSQAGEAVSAADISAFEAKYYLPLGADAFDEQFYSENEGVLLGSTIDESKVVQSYELIYDPTIETDFDSLVTEFKHGKSFSELIRPTVYYYTLASGGNRDAVPGTAILEKVNGHFKVDSFVEADKGKVFCISNDQALYKEISDQYDPEEIEMKFITFYNIGYGILISDGQQESIVFTDPNRHLGVEANVLYSADQVMEKIIAAKDYIVRPPVEMEVNSDGEINCIVG